ncbi:hypothetical protein BGZ50_002773 [Haplosporangium sp. Z 11]|nr:hypothetical protein BGZ50_002773 [Haplosporangium sp. Z 11]
MEHNHYDTLGLGFNSFTQKQLKTNFRKASLQYHPDKVGQAGADMFVRIRTAYEVLVDPVMRPAYDHFGPSTLKCTECTTAKDYMNYGLNEMSSPYMISFAVLALMDLTGKCRYGRYWKFLLLIIMGGLELSMVLSRGPNTALNWLMPNRATFEQIAILRHICLSMVIAVDQIGPLFLPDVVVQKGTVQGSLKLLETLTAQSSKGD